MPGGNGLQYLKQVSRIKHKILENYLGPWARILGSAHQSLQYTDCFAGGGVYVDEHNQLLPGSPVVALRVAKDYGERFANGVFSLGFVEKNKKTADQLRTVLAAEEPLPPSVKYLVVQEDAQDYVTWLVSSAKQQKQGRHIAPSFFFIDPYGHPVTIPVMRQLLSLGQTEILVNLMWFRINMDLNNPNAQARLDYLFGHSFWRQQPFMRLQGPQREHAFLEYFMKEVGAEYSQRFLVRFSPEDRVKGKGKRAKFYLIHFSNHPKAALLMKQVMWGASDEVDELEFSGFSGAKQLRLIGSEPDLDRLRSDLLERFQHIDIEFNAMQVETLDWPFIEKQYREVIKNLESEGIVTIRRVKSKKSGLGEGDFVIFP